MDALLGELTQQLSPPYREAFRHLLGQSEVAAEQYDRGNVMTAFKLLRGDNSVVINPDSGLDKEQVLDAAWLALPTSYQSGDMDPDW